MDVSKWLQWTGGVTAKIDSRVNPISPFTNDAQSAGWLTLRTLTDEILGAHAEKPQLDFRAKE